jgi:hypothetical protein
LRRYDSFPQGDREREWGPAVDGVSLAAQPILRTSLPCVTNSLPRAKKIPCPSEKISLRCHGQEFEEFAASPCKYGLQLISSTAEAATDLQKIPAEFSASRESTSTPKGQRQASRSILFSLVDRSATLGSACGSA